MIKSLWHSFFVQAFFNYHTMVSVGACYLLDHLLGEKNIPKAIRLRLLIFFNGHPYLVPHAIGAISNEIEKGTPEAKVTKFVDSVVGLLGAVGDQYFWGGIKPFFLLLPASFVLLGFSQVALASAMLLSFAAFNALQLKERFRGLEEGKSSGFKIVSYIKAIKNRRGNRVFPQLVLTLVLITLCFYLFELYQSTDLILSGGIALLLGLVSGKRGNSKKYLALALALFTIFEVYVW